MITQRNAGNALFLILIAVVLFGALGYAITRSGRGSGGIDREQALIAASQITQTAGLIQQAVTRLLISGCRDTTISFVYDSNNDGSITAADDYFNAASPADGSCRVFGPNGGGLSFPDTPSNVNDGSKWIFTTNRSFGYEGDNGLNSGSHEIVMMLPAVSATVCVQLNRGLQVTAPFNNTIPIDAGLFNKALFTGTYNCCEAIDNVATPPTWTGAIYSSGLCFNGQASGEATFKNWYSHVILARRP